MINLLAFPTLTFLAQTATQSTLTPEEKMWKVVVGGAILIGVIIVGAAALVMIRNKLRQITPDDAGDTGFTLADLRDMHQRGELTDEEFNNARAKLIAKVKGLEQPPTTDQ